jgi:hypothetical protein
MSRHLKINPPAILPSSGVTSVSFKAWLRTLTAYLEQDINTPLFMPDGAYSTWLPKGKNRARIAALNNDDPDRVELMDRLTAALAARQERPNDQRVDQYTQVQRDRDLATLLTSRNAQLSKFITLIMVLCPHTLTNNIDQLSTSFPGIIAYLEQYYQIQKRGSHFLSIHDIRYNPSDSPENFYMELHGAFEDSLRKRGETVLFRNEEVLEEDEEMSPTLENTVVLLWLERIDPRLPSKVHAVFAHQMVGNTSLRDLQPAICNRIPSLLQELDEAEANRAALHAAAPLDSTDTPVAAAFYTRGGRSRGRTRSFPTRGRNISKFCRICFLLNKGSPNIYTSHNINQCSKLSDRDKQEMARHAAVTLDAEFEDPDHPTPVPGWDLEDDPSQ